MATYVQPDVGDWNPPMAAERARRVAPRSGSRRKDLKMTALEARHGPARPVVRRWLASFLVDMVFR